MNEVSINSKAAGFSEAEITLLYIFFNYYGGYSGTFYPKDQYMSGRSLLKQVETCKERRMEVAKAIVLGIGKNMQEVLYHYYKHDKKK